MRRAVLPPIALALLASISGAQGGAQGGASDRAVIQLSLSLTAQQVEEFTGLQVTGGIPEEGTFGVVRPVWMSATAFELTIQAIQESPLATKAQFDVLMGLPEIHGCGTLPTKYVGPWASMNKYLFAQQCTVGFVSGSQTTAVASNEAWLESIGQPAALELADDTTLLVAVIDTGIDPNHSALVGKLAGNGYDFVLEREGGWDLPNGVDDDGDGLVDEAFGHGTHVAGTILAMNPNVRILSYRVMDSEGVGWALDVARALWHAQKAGADFVNLSIGMAAPSPVVTHHIGALLEDGVEVFVSTGNTGSEWCLYPSTLGVETAFLPSAHTPVEGVVSIGAVQLGGVLAPFSGWGASLDLLAPGVELAGPLPGELWGTWSGTSMATAVATGAATLVRSAGPDAEGTAASYLISSAVSAEPVNPGCEGGLGAGLLDVLAACQAAASSSGQ